MALRKASEEPKASPLSLSDFWAAVQNGGDVQISVANILSFLRTVLVTSDIAELPGKLQAIADKAAADTAAVSADLDQEIAALGTAAKLNAGTGAGKVPVLDGNAKLDVAIIPAVAITDTFAVASDAEMLALAAERGDIAIRSDLNKCFVLKSEPAATLGNWKELLTPTDAVLSVVGLKGAITAAALKTALAMAISDVAGLQAALDALSAGKFDKIGGQLTGDIHIFKTNPRLAFDWPAGFSTYWRLEADGYIYYRSALDDSIIFWIGPGGDFGSKQFGTDPSNGSLNQRIEDRAQAWTNQKTARLVMAGDRSAQALQTTYGNGVIGEPFPGAVVTGLAGDAAWQLLVNARWRYLQLNNTSGAWYTVAYAAS